MRGIQRNYRAHFADNKPRGNLKGDLTCADYNNVPVKHLSDLINSQTYSQMEIPPPSLFLIRFRFDLNVFFILDVHLTENLVKL